MKTEQVLVVGGTPGGLRAAAAAAAMGRRVVLMEPGAMPGGVAFTEIPEGTGTVEWRTPPRSLATEVLGPLTRLQPVAQGVWLEGRLWPLPLGLGQAATLLGAKAPRAAYFWSKARFQEHLGAEFGLWSEVRSFHDWVTLRWGVPLAAYFLDYCARRWGPPGEISASTARWFFEPRPAFRRMVPVLAPAAQAARWAAQVRRGGELRLESPVEGLAWRDGRVVGVSMAGGDVLHGQVLLATPPQRVAALAGRMLAPTLGSDAGWLATRHRLAVSLPVAQNALPPLVHVLDPGCPFFRSVGPGLLPAAAGAECQLVLHADLAEADPLWQAPDADVAEQARQWLGQGMAQPVPGPVHINRLSHHVPVWTLRSHAAWVRLMLAYEGAGLVGVGRVGAFAPLDPLQELDLLARSLQDGTGMRTAYRHVVELPARPSGVSSSWRHFVHRW